MAEDKFEETNLSTVDISQHLIHRVLDRLYQDVKSHIEDNNGKIDPDYEITVSEVGKELLNYSIRLNNLIRNTKGK